MIIENPEYREEVTHYSWGDHTDVHVVLPKGMPSENGAIIVMINNLDYFMQTFGFDGDESNPHFPANYGSNTVAYTGTHDNTTVAGWAAEASKEAIALAMKTLDFSDPEDAPDALGLQRQFP